MSALHSLPRALAVGVTVAAAYAGLCAVLVDMRAYPAPAVAPPPGLPVLLVHDAPTGWTYPYSCCSGVDCRPVPPAFVTEGPSGYVVEPTGEVIPYGDVRLKNSPDGEFHWCSVAGADDGRTICLFVPPRSY